MAGAPYQLDVSFEMEATFELNLQWVLSDGVTIFPFSDYLIEYALAQPGCSPLFTLSSALAGGITTDAVGGIVNILKLNAGLVPGRYEHDCRVTHLASGKVIPAFDGKVTINTDAFR